MRPNRATAAIAVCVLLLAVTAWNLNGAWNARTSAVRARDLTHGQLLDAQASLSAARQRSQLARVDARRAAAERDGAKLSVDIRRNQLGVTQAERDHATSFRDSKNAEVAVVRQCLQGAHVALDALERNDNTATLFALRAVDTACRAAQSAQGGPAPGYGFDFPDPFVLTVGSTQYAFATNASAGNIQVLRNADDGGWTTVGDALAQLPSWAVKGRTWAPAVLARGGQFVLYYAVGENGTGHQCISRAVSTAPTGPYVDTSTGPLTCGDREAIDPEPVVGGDGTPILLWKRERPSTIMAQVLTPDGLSLIGPEHELLHANQGWEGGVVEAPSMIVDGGGAWLFFSGNNWNSAKYSVGVVHCAGPLGPCDRAAPAPILSSHGSIAGPGGAGVFQDSPGHYRVAYHAYVTPHVGYPSSRLLFVGTISFVGGSPIIVD